MSITGPITGRICGGLTESVGGSPYFQYPASGLLACYRGAISEGKLLAQRPITNHTSQQVKGSGFAGAGSATVTGLLTTDTITATGTVPTCSVNGTLTFGVAADCWDVYVHRAGVLWAYWPGINVGKTTELDASGLGHNLTALTTTTITERLDGTGTDHCNTGGYSERENLIRYNRDLSRANWVKRGTIAYSVSAEPPPSQYPAETVILISGLNTSGVGDFYQTYIFGSPGSAMSFDVYIKRVSVAGVVQFAHPAGALYGKDQVDLSAIGAGWIRLRDVATSSVAWKTAPNGELGLLCTKATGTGTLSFLMCAVQINTGATAKAYTATSSSSVIGRQPAISSTLDAVGNALQFPAPLGRDATVNGYAATFTGTEYLAGTQITGSEKILDYAGTGTPSVAAGRIDVTAGSLEWINIDGRMYITQSNPASTQVRFYNVNGSDFLTYTGGTGARCTTKMANAGRLATNGFNITTGDYIPASDRYNLPRNGNGYLLARNEMTLADELTWVDQDSTVLVPSSVHAQNGPSTIKITTVDAVTAATASLTGSFGLLAAGGRIDIMGWIDTPTDITFGITLANAAETKSASRTDLAVNKDWPANSIVLSSTERADFTLAGGWNWSVDAIEKIVISISGASGVNFYLDVIAKTPRARPKVVFVFDDGNSSDYTEAYTYMAAKGLAGTSFVNTSTLDTTGKLTTAQALEMYAAGWEIANHTHTHIQLPTLTTAEIQSTILNCRDALIAMGCPSRAMYVAYPSGAYDDSVLADLAEVGVVAGRTTDMRHQITSLGPTNNLVHPIGTVAHSIGAGNAAADIIAKIAETFSRGTTCIILMHRLVAASPVDYEWSVANFQAVVDYAETKMLAGIIDIVPYGEWYDGTLETGEVGVDCADGNALVGVSGKIAALGACTVEAPLGPKFQAIPEFTNNASVTLNLLTPTDQVYVGEKALLIYETGLSGSNAARATRYVGSAI